MKTRHLILASCAVMALSVGTVQAGPCNTAGKSASMQDAGAGPTPGNTGQSTTTGAAGSGNQHPPTSTMNRASDNVAASSQDAQRQMQAQPTAAQQAQGAKAADQGC